MLAITGGQRHPSMPETPTVLKTQEIKDRLAAFGADVATSTPNEFQQLIHVELAKWGRAVKASGVKMQ